MYCTCSSTAEILCGVAGNLVRVVPQVCLQVDASWPLECIFTPWMKLAVLKCRDENVCTRLAISWDFYFLLSFSKLNVAFCKCFLWCTLAKVCCYVLFGAMLLCLGTARPPVHRGSGCCDHKAGHDKTIGGTLQRLPLFWRRLSRVQRPVVRVCGASVRHALPAQPALMKVHLYLRKEGPQGERVVGGPLSLFESFCAGCRSLCSFQSLSPSNRC